MKIRSGAIMATRYKSAKEMELMAIYRLEFYRKKKNWKFCQDVRKKKADADADTVPKPEPEASDSPKTSKDEKKVLNETYVIDHEQDAEGASELNRAFLETEPDGRDTLLNFFDKLPLTTLPELETEKEKTEEEESYPDCYDILPQEQNLQQLDVCSEPERAWPDWDPDYVQMLPALADYIWQNVPPPQINTVQQVAEHQDFYTNLDYKANFDGWQCGDLWAQNVEEAFFPEGDVCDGLWYPEVILNEAPATANTEDLRSASLESFMLGAAAAPHSTEIDLRATSPDESGCRLSSQQLAMAVAHHAHAIKRLLNEARAREQLALRSQSLEHFWDVPNRDPGPSTPSPPLKREETFIKDPFVAGSFKNSSDLSSSTRGRLRSRPGVIGIRMGRPYRL